MPPLKIVWLTSILGIVTGPHDQSDKHDRKNDAANLKLQLSVDADDGTIS